MQPKVGSKFRVYVLLASEMDANSDATFFLFFLSFLSCGQRLILVLLLRCVIGRWFSTPWIIHWLFSFSLGPCFSLDQVRCFFSLVFPRLFSHCRLFHSVLPVNSCLFWSFIVFVCTINDWSRSHSSSIELVHPYTWVILRSSQARRFTQVPFLPTVSFLFL